MKTIISLCLCEETGKLVCLFRNQKLILDHGVTDSRGVEQ